MQPPMDEMLFDDPMLMQQLGLMPPQMAETQDQSLPADREKPKGEAWSLALILSGIILMIAWIAVPLGAMGAWIYGPIEGFFAQPIFSRFEALCGSALFITVGITIALLYWQAVPKLHWVENDPGVPRITRLKNIEDTGSSFIMKRHDGKMLKVRKDIASRHRNLIHITANVLEIDGRDTDIEFRTTAGSMSRGQIAQEEDLSMRQGFREQQLEDISQRYVSGQMEQIDGVG
jgi:hypothetical protein